MRKNVAILSTCCKCVTLFNKRKLVCLYNIHYKEYARNFNYIENKTLWPQLYFT